MCIVKNCKDWRLYSSQETLKRIEIRKNLKRKIFQIGKRNVEHIEMLTQLARQDSCLSQQNPPSICTYR